MLKIGPYEIKNPYILAPMAGVSQMPFRRLALSLGAGLAPTELVSAKGLFYESLRTKSYLTYDQQVEKPFCVQLFGGEEEAMAVASEKAMAMGAEIIDINMGCPVKKVTKINAGSALLCDMARACAIVRAMLKRTNYKIPITAKIRSGWDQGNLNYIEVGKALADAGISAIALHARTRAQGYSGKACWSHIAELKASLSIPVIGNGDVLNVKDAKRMQKETGCDAVMIGRAALGNPWIFKSLDKVYDINKEERWHTVRTHLFHHIDLHRQIEVNVGLRPFDEMQAIRSFRPHLIWYSKGLAQSSNFRKRILSAECAQQTKEIMEEFFSQAETLTNSNIKDDEGIDYRQAFG